MEQIDRKQPGWLRAQMPQTAQFIDELRAAFGADVIDPVVIAGARGEPGAFYAQEGGFEIGVPPEPRVEFVCFGPERFELERPST